MKSNIKLPENVLFYIREHFGDDFLFEVKEVIKIKDRSQYIISLSKNYDNYILVFNDKGQLIKKEIKHAYPPDNPQQ